MLALIMTGAVVISQFVSFSYSVLLPTMCVKESSLNLQLVHLVKDDYRLLYGLFENKHIIWHCSVFKKLLI